MSTNERPKCSDIPTAEFNLRGRPGATQPQNSHCHRMHQATPYTPTQPCCNGGNVAPAASSTRRRRRSHAVERSLLDQKYAILRRSHAAQRQRLSQARQRQRQQAVELRKLEHEKAELKRKLVEWCKKALSDSAAAHKRTLDAYTETIRRLQRENEDAADEINRLRLQLTNRSSQQLTPAATPTSAQPVQPQYDSFMSVDTSLRSDDSGVEEDDLPGEEDNVTGCRSKVVLLDLAADAERLIRPVLGFNHKYLIVHKHKDLRLRGFDGAETHFDTLDAMQDALLAGGVADVQILQLVYMRIGWRLMEFLRRTAERSQRFAGISLQILDFSQHSRLFDDMLQDLMFNAHTLHIRNVRGVNATPTVLGMLTDRRSSIDHLVIKYFSDGCRQPIRFSVDEVLGYLHHGDGHNRRRVLHIYDDNVAINGDATATLAKQCKNKFQSATKPSSYVLRACGRAHLRSRCNQTPAEELRNERTGELLRIVPLTPSPADDFRRAVLVERRRLLAGDQTSSSLQTEENEMDF